jgi:transcription initiation factor IIE alpha subunit
VFGEITDEEIKDLVPLLKKSLQFIIKKFREMGAMRKGGDDLDEVPYNYYLYHGTDWYLRIIPRLIHRAGFELGTGLSVNIVDPAIAAEEYRAGLAG